MKSSKPLTEKQIASIRKLWNDGYSEREIAAILGVSATSVRKYTKDLKEPLS